ncbi:hypothetical protein XU18_2038 [Perkinsela sp. CCAP 1560/4]|nr:hypothetical protein XU18_2038 [Perkinsela sp. CCAP 1560/4]|eukprot:KNH07506.1 hypothetical protein XU18_2038 [Perkinsela sp. CCAP 1560/4]
MSTPVVSIFPPPDGFLSLPANPFYDHRREKMRQMDDDECHDLPGDFPHFCDVCEKGFNTEQQYRSHLGKHIWCDAPGCKFTCLKDKDWKMEMHKTTLHDRDDAPDLANTDKYLAARRHKFPTAEKILTRVEEYQLRVARGDYITKDQWKWMKKHERMAQDEANTELSEETPVLVQNDNSGDANNAEHRQEPSTRDGNSNILRQESSGTDDSSDDSETGEGRVEKPPTPVSNMHRSIEFGSKKPLPTGKAKSRQRKRKPSLFEKLTVGERVLEKGQVLQAVRYFVATDFLTRMPKW